ncbi:MAG: hypothetical protein KJ706_08670 [Candidatus Omnitrophica bacterium]|nr:hypothetical protein [Candidatus Omnitrophota bacterium]MCG2814128.1 hypothetical protein [Thermodesulfovibrionales bacterium]
MPDVINHIENTETGKTELWITIKDASDLLGISERHTWRILLQNAWKTQKLPNKDRKKTYILRPDVEKYYKAEQERQRLEQLKPLPLSDTPDISDKSDKTSVFDKSDIINKPMSDIKNLPILMSDYRNILIDLQKKQEQLITKATRWKTSAIWLAVLAVFIGGFMGLFLYDTKKMMSDNKREMSDRINDLSDKVTEAQKELSSTKETLFQKEIWINRLEQTVPQEKREGERGVNGQH